MAPLKSKFNSILKARDEHLEAKYGPFRFVIACIRNSIHFSLFELWTLVVKYRAIIKHWSYFHWVLTNIKICRWETILIYRTWCFTGYKSRHSRNTPVPALNWPKFQAKPKHARYSDCRLCFCRLQVFRTQGTTGVSTSGAMLGM